MIIERVVEINQLLNGVHGETLKAFGHHLQNVSWFFLIVNISRSVRRSTRNSRMKVMRMC